MPATSDASSALDAAPNRARCGNLRSLEPWGVSRAPVEIVHQVAVLSLDLSSTLYIDNGPFLGWTDSTSWLVEEWSPPHGPSSTARPSGHVPRRLTPDRP